MEEDSVSSLENEQLVSISNNEEHKAVDGLIHQLRHERKTSIKHRRSILLFPRRQSSQYHLGQEKNGGNYQSFDQSLSTLFSSLEQEVEGADSTALTTFTGGEEKELGNQLALGTRKRRHRRKRRRTGSSSSIISNRRNPLFSPLLAESNNEQQDQEQRQLSRRRRRTLLPSFSRDDDESKENYHMMENKKALEFTREINDIVSKYDERKLLERQTSTTNHRRTSLLPKILLPNAVPLKLQLDSNDRRLCFERRNKRMDTAKEMRITRKQERETKLLSDIERKDQKRILYSEQCELYDSQFSMIIMITLCSALQHNLRNVPQIIGKYRKRKSQNQAATRIQAAWRGKVVTNALMDAKNVRSKLKGIKWRIILWVRCTRRRMNAQLLRRFFQNFRIHQQMNYIIYTFRARVLKAQRFIKSFVDCKKARLILMEKLFTQVEQKIISAETLHNQRQRKNALNDILRQKTMMQNRARQIHTENSTAENGMSRRSSNRISMRLSINLLQFPIAVKGLTDTELSRVMCRFHLEDERRKFIKATVEDIKASADGPILNINHAKMLLSGEEFDINLDGKTSWPMFTIYDRTKESLKKSIENIRHDDDDSLKDLFNKRVEDGEVIIKEANRYAIVGSRDGYISGDDVSDPRNVLQHDIDNALASKNKTSLKSIQELREIFQLVDLDGGGTIDCKELGKLFDLLGMTREDDEIEDMMEIMSGKSGADAELDFAQFADAVYSTESRQDDETRHVYSEESILAAFQAFSSNMQDGMIDRERLLEALQSFEGKLDNRSARLAIRDAGFGRVNIINYKKFVRINKSIGNF